MNFDPKLVAVTGDLNSAILLSQLKYWFTPAKNGKSKITIQRGGRYWLAKSRASLMEETGLTVAKLRRALSILTAQGWLVSEIHLFGNKTMPHLWIDYDRLCGTLTPGCAVSTQPLTESVITAETTAEDLAAEAAEVARKDPDKIEQGEIEDRIATEVKVEDRIEPGNVISIFAKKGEAVSKVQDILKHHRDRGRPVGPLNVPKAAALWKRLYSEAYPGFVKGFTGQELGQMKMFLERAGTAAGSCLEYALGDWSKFAFEARVRYGLSAVPDRPVVGFLLKYHDVVLQLIAKKPVESVPAPVEEVAEIEQAPPGEAVGSAEVLAALSSLKKSQGG